MWSSYLGRGDEDWANDVTVDLAGNIFITGGTDSSGWMTNGFDSLHNGGEDAFITKLTPEGVLLFGPVTWEGPATISGSQSAWAQYGTCMWQGQHILRVG